MKNLNKKLRSYSVVRRKGYPSWWGKKREAKYFKVKRWLQVWGVGWLSFGTNDLTQYAFAVDRDNPSIEQYFDDTHSVVFQLLDIARKAAKNVPLSICGELAGYADRIGQLLACDIGSLSVAPAMIPACKEVVRNAALNKRKA